MATQPTTFLGQLLARLNSETPIFFKKIMYFGVFLGAIGGSIITATKAGAVLPPILTEYAGYLVSVGLVCAGVSKAATTDPNLQAKGGSNVDVNDGGESKIADKAPQP